MECIYYLEKGDMMGVYYVLGYSAPGMHATVQLYQGEKPSFFEVRFSLASNVDVKLVLSLFPSSFSLYRLNEE